MTWLLATRKGLFVLDDDGISGRHFLGVNISLAMADPRDGAWYAALDHGHFGTKLQRSRDRGATWQEIAVPVYPPKPSDAPELGADGRPLAWDLKRIWAFEAGAVSQPGRLWCGTIPGGLFRSDDHGDTWQLVESLWHHPSRTQWFGGGADHPGLHSVCVDPRDPRTVRIAVSCGGVWTTRDDGASWTNTSQGLFATFMPPDRQGDPNVQDVHSMVQCLSEPDHLWIQHHNGIFRSIDGAQTWQHCPDVPPSGIGFGFAVAVDPRRGSRAWFVPARKDEFRIPVDGKVVVTRTDDGGSTWMVIRDGLPQQDAYDLTLRHALAIDGSGKRLAFGSTTGSVWESRDGGDHWQERSAHLPPIHAVRWLD